MDAEDNPLAPFIKGEFLKSPLEKGVRGLLKNLLKSNTLDW